MGNESFKLAVKDVEVRRQNALFETSRRNEEVSAKIYRVKELNILLAKTGMQLSKVIFSKGKNARFEIDKIMEENLKNQQELESILLQNGYAKDYLDIHYTCKKCEDSGYVNGLKCECLKRLITKYNVLEFNSSNKLDSISASFQSFSVKYYSDAIENSSHSQRDIMSAILSSCMGYAAKFNKHSPSILMIGDTGLGKTHLSLAIAEEVMQNGFSALYASAPDLFRKIQNEYYGKGEPGVDTMETLQKADLVIVDDLGAEIENQFNISALYNLINMRLNANRPVIISTNLTPKQLEKRYTDRIASRLMTLYKCLKFVGNDVRQIKLHNNEL